MLQGWVILTISLLYLGLLFAIASYGDRRADQGRSIISSPLVYALSLAVYCTSWTFYGSVGRAAVSGLDFLPIYLGPTLASFLGWLVLRRMIRISKHQRITSIADFGAARYGKSTVLAGLITIVAVIGVTPYIALQLKAISTSFDTLLQAPAADAALLSDKGFYAALLLALFAILFGTRKLDATERHEGMVAAIAFESLVKLVAFLAVGAFVTFGMYGGPADLFGQAARLPEATRLLSLGEGSTSYGSWAALTLLAMLAVLLLPRQFQIAVVENVSERHLLKATWLFPLYLLAINLFVMPVALAGLLHFAPGTTDADMFVLTLPILAGQEELALLAYLGGASAATGMVIAETVALSTMVCNDLVMPVLLRLPVLRLNERADLSGLLLTIRRVAILLLLLLGYAYFRLIGEAAALVSIGLVSFAAVAQFAPAILGGMFWKTGNRLGALVGLTLGFLVWSYTLPLPSLAQSGWLPSGFVEQGLFGIAALRPTALLGLEGMDEISHALFWSLLLNAGAYVGISLLTPQSAEERRQAALFVDVFRQSPGDEAAGWRGHAPLADVRALLGRFLGAARADEALETHARQRGFSWAARREGDSETLLFAESLLAGAIGGASARLMVAAIAREETLEPAQVKHLLDDATQVVAYSYELERKSHELQLVTEELRAANGRLKELDRLKDEFISTVTHELRTPLTSIRAISEILHDTPDMDTARRTHFLSVIIKESERLTRLINQVLDLAKIESGNAEWHISPVDLREIIELSLMATGQLFEERGVRLALDLPPEVPLVPADQDRLIQVMLNLLSNAVKFCDPLDGRVLVRLAVETDTLRVDVQDNGRGISPEDQCLIFEKFRQVSDTITGKPQGTGLGLPISRQIIAFHGGHLWVESTFGEGATFSFTLPREMRNA
ncbi:MAG TPA: sensor histidine kinase [Roseiflexaceae bacterium]|nr:sensor histidine kinase [Roseiflexaceae bacterium]